MSRHDQVLGEQREAIRCAAERSRARSISLVGSTARGEDADTSDLDFLVDFDPGITLFGICRLETEISRMFDGCSVDVVPLSCLRESHKGKLRDAILLCVERMKNASMTFWPGVVASPGSLHRASSG